MTGRANDKGDIHAWTFGSSVDVDGACYLLAGVVPGFTFTIRESEDEGRYLNGTHPDGTRMRLLAGQGVLAELELHFPSPERGGPLAEEAKARLLGQVVPGVLGQLGARDIRRER